MEGFVAFAQLTGPDHVVEACNDSWRQLFPGEDCLGVAFTKIAPDIVAQGAFGGLDRVYAEGVPFYGGQQTFPGGSGADLVLDVRLEPRYEPGGRIVGVNVFAVDVTEQARATHLLREQRELLEKVATSGSLSDVLTRLIELIEQMSTDGMLGSVLLVDETGHLRHGAAPSLPQFYNEAIDGVAIGPSVGSCGTAAYRRQPVIVTDVRTDPLWADYRDLADRAGLRACWSSPILSGDGPVLGTFAMYYRTPRAPTREDLAASQMFARTAALAIERHRLDRARAAAEEDLQFLLDASVSIATASGHVDSAERLARLVVPRLCAACVIDLATDQSIERVAVAVDGDPAAEQRLIRHTPSRGSDHPAARVLASPAPQTLRGVDVKRYAVNDDHRDVLETAGVDEFASVPLTAGGVTFGALTMMATPQRPLTDAAIAVAEDLSRRIAQVLDRVRQFDGRVRLVRELQTELLPPRLPVIPGLRFAASYHPGTAELDVGGDFYDVFPLGGNRWAVIVGDVSGRGARAASTTALVRFTTRAVAPLASSAAHVLPAANDALLAVEDDERFITAVYAELSVREGGVDVELVSAGHPCPIVRRAGGGVEVTTATGPLLGQLPGVSYDVERLTLSPGDTLLMVTDGVLEARNREREMFGDDRLVRAAESAAEGADATVAAVDVAVASFAATADDDRAVLAVTAVAH